MKERSRPFHSGPNEWPSDGLESVPNCPVCDSNARRELYEGLFDNTFFCAPGTWQLHECLDCGSAYLDPRPTEDSIHLAYQDYYTHSPGVRQPEVNLSWLKKTARSLANGYRNSRFGGDLKPSSRFGRPAIKALPYYRRRLDQEMRQLPPVWPKATLLDIGCGNCHFISMAQAIGWEVAGVDPDLIVAQNAHEQGFDVRVGGVEAFSDRPGYFDALVCSQVIEHLSDPRSTLKRAVELLKPGGLLYLDTPNIQSSGLNRFGQHWRGLEAPRHLVLFSWDSLEQLLKECGFEDIRRVPRPESHARMAASSRAISRGVNPAKQPISTLDRITGMAHAFASRIDYRRTDFVTLFARTPE